MKYDKQNTPEKTAALIGNNLHSLRTKQGYSLRGLSQHSGLSVNTLSMIENGRTSPSVTTLAQLADAMRVPLAAFFESEVISRRVVYSSAANRPQITHGSTVFQNLGEMLAGNAVQPYIVHIDPGMGSGTQPVVHTGYELVYTLKGTIEYKIEDETYLLTPGDSLVFQAHLPHRWENCGTVPSEILIVFCPSDEQETPDEHHFSKHTIKEEINMKIAVITDDGKTISRHFGRAPYYLILTLEEGKVVDRELREKMGHTQFASQHTDHEDNVVGHGMSTSSHSKHISMAESIADCKALICGGMGMGAYNSMKSLNIMPIVTDMVNIDEVVKAFLDGKLVDHTELLH